MKFSRSREQKNMESAWEKTIRSSTPAGSLNSIKLFGPCGSGKTFFAQELVRTQRGNYYMSFEGMTREEALHKFVRLYLPENVAVSSWADAAKAFAELRHHRRTLLIFEDEAEELQRECKDAFAPYTRRKGLFRICEITHEISPKEKHCVPIPFLSFRKKRTIWNGNYSKKLYVRLCKPVDFHLTLVRAKRLEVAPDAGMRFR